MVDIFSLQNSTLAGATTNFLRRGHIYKQRKLLRPSNRCRRKRLFRQQVACHSALLQVDATCRNLLWACRHNTIQVRGPDVCSGTRLPPVPGYIHVLSSAVTCHSRCWSRLEPAPPVVLRYNYVPGSVGWQYALYSQDIHIREGIDTRRTRDSTLTLTLTWWMGSLLKTRNIMEGFSFS